MLNELEATASEETEKDSVPQIGWRPSRKAYERVMRLMKFAEKPTISSTLDFAVTTACEVNGIRVPNYPIRRKSRRP